MTLEQTPPPVNKTPPREATIVEALEEIVSREFGPPGDPDGFYQRAARPTPKQRAKRDAEVEANQPENLN